ncbi:MAG: hypothetical protein OEN56_05790, partial [Gemmatimonadota bacterium]|nr:hypothetical protein [Gemmatimonadota bacterium]
AAPVAGPDGRDRWVVRHYRRGGAVASLLGDRYFSLGRPRPVRELAVSVTARARGVPTPAVVAAAVYRAGLFDRYDLVTELVPSVQPLAAWLEGSTPLAGWERAVDGAARLVRQLSDAGIVHVDLNAHNVLLSPEEPENGWVVDLDRARVTSAPNREVARRMSTRLLRSVRKIAATAGTRIDADETGRTLHATADAGEVNE